MIKFTLIFLAGAILMYSTIGLLLLILLMKGLIKSAGMVSRAEEETEARRIGHV